MEKSHGWYWGTVKNTVFRKVESGNIVIDSLKELIYYASQLVTSKTSLYLPVEEIIEEPEEIARAPAIAGTMKIHKVIRKHNSRKFISNFSIYLTKASQPLSSSIKKMMIALFVII